MDATGDPQAAAMLGELAAKVRASMALERLAGFLADVPFCKWLVVKEHAIRRLERSRFPFLFQTTTRRWFADPLFSLGKAIDAPCAP